MTTRRLVFPAALALAAIGWAAGGRRALTPPGAVPWETLHPGFEVGTVRIAAPGEGRWSRLALLRMDPARYRLSLETRLAPGFETGAWTVDSAEHGAIAAFNAGQFSGIVPWGWTVIDGHEIRPPGTGPLSMAVVSDAAGAIRFVPADSIEVVRREQGVQTAFQSYPALLTGAGEIPLAIREPGHGVDVGHRDARLALCQLRDGRLLVLLTRFDGLGEAGGGIPLGLTLAETASLLQAQGCLRAVALDGGISAQLMARGADGETRAWRGWRKVPLGVVVREGERGAGSCEG